MNTIKPDYLKSGNVFSQLHRQLEGYRYMSDLDEMEVRIGGLPVTADTENNTFCEYSIDRNGAPTLEVSAIFDFKQKDTPSVRESLNNVYPGGSLWMQTQLAAQLHCRFFVVVASEGGFPLTFYELYPFRQVCGTVYGFPRDAVERRSLAEFWHKKLGL